MHRVYEGWNRDDFAVAEELFHPDIEWHTSGVFPGFKPVYRGIEGVREFWGTMKDAWEHMTIRVERTLDEDDGNVVVAVRFEAKGKQSGVPVELVFANLWQLRDGLVVRFASYPSFEMALEAAGL